MQNTFMSFTDLSYNCYAWLHPLTSFHVQTNAAIANFRKYVGKEQLIRERTSLFVLLTEIMWKHANCFSNFVIIDSLLLCKAQINFCQLIENNRLFLFLNVFIIFS
jgi:hypothetical protein